MNLLDVRIIANGGQAIGALEQDEMINAQNGKKEKSHARAYKQNS
jgi:hypothetical protein